MSDSFGGGEQMVMAGSSRESYTFYLKSPVWLKVFGGWFWNWIEVLGVSEFYPQGCHLSARLAAATDAKTWHTDMQIQAVQATHALSHKFGSRPGQPGIWVSSCQVLAFVTAALISARWRGGTCLLILRYLGSTTSLSCLDHLNLLIWWTSPPCSVVTVVLASR